MCQNDNYIKIIMRNGMCRDEKQTDEEMKSRFKHVPSRPFNKTFATHKNNTLLICLYVFKKILHLLAPKQNSVVY